MAVVEEVKRRIEEMVEVGELVGGSLLPSERALSERLKVSRGTIRVAISQLVSSGLLASAPRQGTVVAPKAKPSLGIQHEGFWSVIVPLVDYFYPKLIDAIEQELAALGKQVVLACSRGSLEREKELVDRHISLGAKAIIIAPVLSSANPLQQSRPYLALLPVPVVLIDHTGDDLPDVDMVLNDHFSGAYDATSHLIHARRTSIALIYPDSDTNIGSERILGYRAALDDQGYHEPDMPNICASDIKNGLENKLRDAIDSGVDAFLALNDTIACAIISLLAKMSVRVPEDIAIVGYDDEPQSALTNPPLTTVQVNKTRMAHLAVELLQQRIKQKVTGRYRRLSVRPKLIIRASCGSPPSDEQRNAINQLPSTVS